MQPHFPLPALSLQIFIFKSELSCCKQVPARSWVSLFQSEGIFALCDACSCVRWKLCHSPFDNIYQIDFFSGVWFHASKQTAMCALRVLVAVVVWFISSTWFLINFDVKTCVHTQSREIFYYCCSPLIYSCISFHLLNHPHWEIHICSWGRYG